MDLFENLQYLPCLRSIDQVNWKAAKNKKPLAESDERLLQIVKCGALTQLGKLHTAHSIFGVSILI